MEAGTEAPPAAEVLHAHLRARRDAWFCLPVLYAMALDAAITLFFQPPEYWADPAHVQEANGTWAALLVHGPAIFEAAFLLYMAAVAGLMLWLRGTLQKVLGMFVFLAHAYGAASWAHVAPGEESYRWVLLAVVLSQALAFAAYWRLSPLCEKYLNAAPSRLPFFQ